MKLIDLAECVFCKVSIYQFMKSAKFVTENLYKGQMMNVPKELMRREVRTIHSKEDGTLGICLEREEANNETTKEADI